MSVRNGLMTLCILAAWCMSACSGGGGTSSSGLPQGQAPSSGASTSAATRSYLLRSAAASYDLPPLGGFSGSLVLPATTVPANTRLQLTSTLQPPAGSPILAQGAQRRTQNDGTLNVYFYTTIQLSWTVTFPTLPEFSVTLPPTINPAGLQFFYAISNPTPTNDAAVQFRTEGPAKVSGQVVSFTPSTTPLTLLADTPYIIALYAITPIAAPMASGNIYVANYGGEYFDAGILMTFTADGTRIAPTIQSGIGDLGVAVDAAGKIYITNDGGTLTTYLPNGTQSTPTITGLQNPFGVAVDAAGKIYVTSTKNPSLNVGTVTTYLPNGTQTTPTITGLIDPVSVAVDANGKIYVVSLGTTNGSLTTYLPNGTPTTPALTGLSNGPYAVSVDAAGKIYLLTEYNPDGGRVTTYLPNGTQTTPTITGLSAPTGLTVDAAGKIYIAQNTYGPNAAGTVTTYTANGTITTPSITGLDEPYGIAVH